MLRFDLQPHLTNLHVSDLLHPGIRSWNHESLQNLLNSNEIEEVLKVPMFCSTKEDMRFRHISCAWREFLTPIILRFLASGFKFGSSRFLPR